MRVSIDDGEVYWNTQELERSGLDIVGDNLTELQDDHTQKNEEDPRTPVTGKGKGSGKRKRARQEDGQAQDDAQADGADGMDGADNPADDQGEAQGMEEDQDQGRKEGAEQVPEVLCPWSASEGDL